MVADAHIVMPLASQGTGKTTLLRRFLEQIPADWQPFTHRLMCGRVYQPYAAGKAIGNFPSFLATLALCVPWTILARGARVTYPSFGEKAQDYQYSVSAIKLQTQPSYLSSRDNVFLKYMQGATRGRS